MTIKTWLGYVSPLLLLSVFAITASAQGTNDSQVLTYSISEKPPTTTTGKTAVKILGFNVFRFNGYISTQSVVVERQKTPLETSKGTGPLDNIEVVKAKIKQLNDALNHEAIEAAAYRSILKEFPGKLLPIEDQGKVISRLNAALKDSESLTEDANVLLVVTDYSKLTTGKDADTDKSVNALSARITTVETKNTTSFLVQWRPRAEYARDSSHWVLGPTPLKCEAQWFGRTDSQAISLITTDQKDDIPSESTTVITTNACVPVLTITSGLGISTVRSSTYAFTSKTNYSISTPTSTQVIGYSADQSIVPLYVVQMNYGIGAAKSLQTHAAGGVGVSSSGGSTNADFFAGPAFSFVRRAVFVTPSLHLTQRQALQDGYQVNDPKADMSSVPVINRWKYGFAVTITFPVLGK